MNIQNISAQTIIDLTINHPYQANDTEFLLELNKIIDCYETKIAIEELGKSYWY